LADALDRLAAEAEPGIRAALIRIIEATRESLSLDAILTALLEGAAGQLADDAVDALGRRLAVLVDRLTEIYENAGTAMAAALAAGYTGSPIEVRLDTRNPRVASWARDYGADLVAGATEQQRDALRAIMGRGLDEGRHPTRPSAERPVTMAREIRDVIGLNAQQANALRNFRRGLEQRELGRALGRDLGSTLTAQVRAALRQPELIDTGRIDELVESYRQRLLRHRAEMIARTESIRALSEGQQETMRQAVEAGALNGNTLRRYWLLARDEKTCPICSGIPASNPDGVGLDEPFRSSKGPVMNPPEPHPACRCSVFYRAGAGGLLGELNPAPRLVRDRALGWRRYETLAEAYRRKPGPLRRRARR
jgi:hypothetical protein